MHDPRNDAAPVGAEALSLEQRKADRGKAAAPAKARLVYPDQAAA